MHEYMGRLSNDRNKVPEHSHRAGRCSGETRTAEEAGMAEDREKITTGPNERAVNETIAGTGPGIPDEALAPDEELAQPPTDEQVERIARSLDAPVLERDTLPLEGE
jgi:hypothetical protein